MQVRDILRRKGQYVLSVRPSDPIPFVIRSLIDHNIGAVVVIDENNRLKGIIMERDVLSALDSHREELFSLRAQDVMRRSLLTCSPEDNINRVMKIMTDYRVRHLPVMEDGRLTGIVSLGDVVKHRLQEMETEKNVLRDTLMARGIGATMI